MLVDGTDGKLVLSNNVIQDLSNVYVPTPPTGGDALVWNAVDSRWEAGNVSVAAGVFDGDMQGSVFGDDSTLIVDGVNNTITAQTMSVFNIVPRDVAGVLIDNNIPGSATILTVESEGETPVFTMSRFEPLLDLSVTQTSTPLFGDYSSHSWSGANPSELIAAINFQTIDLSGANLYGGYIRSQNDGLFIGHSTIGDVDIGTAIRIIDRYVTIGDINPIEDVTINGSVWTSGIITAPGIKASILWPDSTIAIDLATQTINGYNATFNGRVIVNELAGDVLGADSSKIIDYTNSTITAGGFVQFGSYNTTERNALTAVNGMVIYNSQVNRFQGYQNSAWINIDDGTAA
jgi:hypothetical protein